MIEVNISYSIHLRKLMNFRTVLTHLIEAWSSKHKPLCTVCQLGCNVKVYASVVLPGSICELNGARMKLSGTKWSVAAIKNYNKIYKTCIHWGVCTWTIFSGWLMLLKVAGQWWVEQCFSLHHSGQILSQLSRYPWWHFHSCGSCGVI